MRATVWAGIALIVIGVAFYIRGGISPWVAGSTVGAGVLSAGFGLRREKPEPEVDRPL